MLPRSQPLGTKYVQVGNEFRGFRRRPSFHLFPPRPYVFQCNFESAVALLPGGERTDSFPASFPMPFRLVVNFQDDAQARSTSRHCVHALVRIRGHFVPEHEPRTYVFCLQWELTRVWPRKATSNTYALAIHARRSGLRVHVSRRSIRLINCLICPPPCTLACARRALVRITV